MKTKEIQKVICRSEIEKGNIPCENVSFLFNSEIDVLSISKSDLVTEYEVKVSKSDFKADGKKRKWIDYTHTDYKSCPNYFYYVCPPDLIKEEELPYPFMGLIYVNNNGFILCIRKAKRIHKEKFDRLTVITKFVRNYSERTHYDGVTKFTYDNRIPKEYKNINYVDGLILEFDFSDPVIDHSDFFKTNSDYVFIAGHLQFNNMVEFKYLGINNKTNRKVFKVISHLSTFTNMIFLINGFVKIQEKDVHGSNINIRFPIIGHLYNSFDNYE